MSHVTKVNLKINDLDALDEACTQLGLELQRGKKTHAWWGTFVGDSRAYGDHNPADFGKCEHAIKIKGDKPVNGHYGPWEIGVVKAKDGEGYDLLYDTYGGAGQRLTQVVGQDVTTLRKEYAFAQASRKARATLARKGWSTAREELPNGALKLKLRKR